MLSIDISIAEIVIVGSTSNIFYGWQIAVVIMARNATETIVSSHDFCTLRMHNVAEGLNTKSTYSKPVSRTMHT